MQLSSSDVPVGIPNADILYVEDDEEQRNCIKELLQVEGYRVAEAGNGREALSYLRSAPAPALILLDLEMPVMGGIEFLAWLKRESELADIPVMIISAGVKSAVLAGPNVLQFRLGKPFDPRELLFYISRLLQRRARA